VDYNANREMYEFPAVAHFHGWFNGFEPRNPGKPILCSRNQRLNVYSGVTQIYFRDRLNRMARRMKKFLNPNAFGGDFCLPCRN